MKQIIIFLLLSITLIFVFVCSKDKPVTPPIPENPGYYYPRQKDYAWRYIQLGRAGCDAIYDSFDLKILGTNRRHDDVGFDRYRVDINDTNFIFEKKDTLFLEKVGQSAPLLKILVGPIRAGTFWRDSHYDYLIQGFEDVTLTINGETYKRCAKIIKTPRNPTPSKPDKVYEWWVPGYGEVKEIEDSLGICVRAKELRYFSPTGVFP
jgi:hypothetical protein